MKTDQNNFNLLRFILAALVLLSHAPELLYGGQKREFLTMIFHTMTFGGVAVGGFFLLSGYLILKSWDNNPDAPVFLEKRIRRIFPAFIVASLISAFLLAPFGAASIAAYFSNFSIGPFLTGVAMLQPTVTPPVFQGHSYSIINGSMWTISIEFCCYLGVILVGLAGAAKRLPWAVMALFLLVTSLTSKFGFGPWFAEQFHFDLLAYFGVGGCFYLFRDQIRYTRAGALAAALVLFIGLFSWRGHTLPFALAGGYLIFCFAFYRNAFMLKFNRLPDVSYGLYLYGWPVQKLLIWYVPGISPVVLFFISLGIATSLGAASWHLVEKRFLNAKKRVVKHPGIKLTA